MLTIIYVIIFCIGIIGFIMTVAAGATLAERRIAAYIQDRIGPNRVGPFGTLQVVADGIKIFFKEDFIPSYVNKPIFWLAPIIAFVPAIINLSIIPFGSISWTADDAIVLADVNVGILFFLAITSIAGYGFAYAGWASNSKYSLLGGLRSAAQLISFELGMGLALISIILFSGEITLKNIIGSQMEHGWNVFTQPLAFIIFLTAAFAECNRTPFDIPEAEQEIVSGYHTEFSSMRFGMFMFGEYIALITMSAFITCLFLGGWDIPFIGKEGFGSEVFNVIASVASFLTKTFLLVFFYMWVRWTLPRFRWDQLMTLGWKILIPLGLLNIVITALLML